MTTQAYYMMVGGFLGAGKTTAIGKMARILTERGLRVGLITNDQGSGLADTVRLRSQGFAVEEIPGGCFCCRFNSLVSAAQRLTEETAPDLFLAEPVGSCTDLVATVSYPLRRIYGDRYTIAPLSVVLDPIRVLRILGKREGKPFSSKVIYIYKKQMEEADLLVVNKCDLLGEAERQETIHAIEEEFPGKPVLSLSAKTGEGVEEWLDSLLREPSAGPTAIELDYDLYAEGEALLGWLNVSLRLESAEEIDGNGLLEGLAERLKKRLAAKKIGVAHLKMTLSPDEGMGGIGSLSYVGDEQVPQLGDCLEDPVLSGDLVVNLRAEGDPEVLWHVLRETVEDPGWGPRDCLKIVHHEAFRPGRPEPTHRLAAVVEETD